MTETSRRVARRAIDRGMSHTELLALPVSVPIQEAGRAFGLSRDGAYYLLKRGQFPCRTIRVGRTTKVPRAELFRVLGITDGDDALANAGGGTA